jgi:7-cyano-7-deazaguanine synthase
VSRGSAIAMVSGGLDSLVALALAQRDLDIRLVLYFDYGHRARESELASAMAAANFYGLEFREVNLRWLGDLSPRGMRAGGDNAELTSLEDVWIPNRNGLFINVAAAFAESYGCDAVVCGFNREEAAEFPDNSADFVQQSTAALQFSTRNGVALRSDTLAMDKREMLRAGADAGAPLSIVWSCYHSGQRMCGRCASCLRLKAALASLPEDERPVLEFEP